MKYGFSTSNFGICGDVRVLAELAREAERSGWDAYFIWDHVNWPGMEPTVDPWVALTAMTLATERIRLGTLVTPLPRRRPWKLARETTSIDHLSGGRLILGVGGGLWPEEFDRLGDEPDPKVRAEMLDEGLALLTALWSGEPVRHEGKHYQVDTAAFAPPVQRPRIPIWVAATWPRKKMLRRAARWDGVAPLNTDWTKELTTEEVREVVAYIRSQRTDDTPFDVIRLGVTAGSGADDVSLAKSHETAGATWWMEYRWTWATTLDEIFERVRRGPPRS